MKREKLSPFFFISSLVVIIILCNCQNISSSRSQEIQNLRVFTKLYGYVKYFHPSDEASRIDWDKFAIYGAEKVKNAKNSQALKSILQELFLPIAPTIQIYPSNEKPEKPMQQQPKDTTGLKVVAWQHQGVGLGGSPAYASIRLNRENKMPTISPSRFGAVNQSIDAAEYRGKEIRLIAHVKTNVRGAGNQGQLWLRVDRENMKRGFFDNMADRPIKSNEWKEYKITGRVNDDALNIVFGCFLMGEGQVWIDDFCLFVKNENDEWESIEISNPGFEEGDVDTAPKKWFARSPGYIAKIKKENPFKGEKCLLIEKAVRYFSGKLFDKHPEVGEIINKKLDANLSCQIPLALYSEENHTLGKNDKFPFEDILSKLDAMDDIELTANNESVRLGNVVITWNVFQHFYPYFDVVNVDWDKELTNTLKESLTNKNEKDFFYTINRLVAKLQDGHGGVYHKMQSEQAGFSFKVDWIENKVVIIVSEDTSNFEKGDIILSVDGIKAEQVLLDAEEYISGSSQWKRYKSLLRFGYGKQGTKAKLKIKRRDKAFKIEVERNFKGQIAEFEKPNIQKLDNNIFYVNLSKATMKEINENINDLAQAKGVVFDLRGYPNGNHEVICHLLQENDTSKAWMRVSQIIYPDQENIVGFQKMGWGLKARQPRIKGKAVFLTDGRAISYAESFMSFIEFYKLGEIVGQPTAGANGNVNPFNLPGGFSVAWTGMKVLKHDGSQHHTIGIQPTVPMQRTIKGVIEERDEFLEKALEIIIKIQIPNGLV